MTEEMEQRLNFSVIEFVNRYCDQRREVLASKQVRNAYRDANSDLIRASGITSAQLFRMINYVLLIGYPEDPFLVSEFDLNMTPANAPSELTLADFARFDAALELYGKEMRASTEAIQRFIHRPYAAKLGGVARELMQLLEADYCHAKAGGRRQGWTEEIDSLIAPVRRRRPELGIADALFAALPKRLAFHATSEVKA